MLPLYATPAAVQFLTNAQGSFVVLGEGAHAVVYEARLQGTPVAAKASRVGLLPGEQLKVALLCRRVGVTWLERDRGQRGQRGVV